MFNCTSLNILNILLTSLCLSSSYTVLFGTPVHVPPCCTFLSMGCCHSPTLLWFLLSYSIFWVWDLTLFSFQYSFSYCILSSFYTLYTAPLSSLPSLLLSLSSFMLPGKGYTIYFWLVFQRETLVFNFYGFEPPYLHIPHTLHRLLLSSLWSIPSQVEVPLLGACSPCYNISVPFPM